MWRQNSISQKQQTHHAAPSGGCHWRLPIKAARPLGNQTKWLTAAAASCDRGRHETTLYEPLSENLKKERRDVQNTQHPTSATAKKAALKLLDHADG